jgi:hypothetical protein
MIQVVEYLSSKQEAEFKPQYHKKKKKKIASESKVFKNKSTGA